MKILFETGFEIVLNDIEIEYTFSSPIFTPLSGEWSYPFTLKATDEILAFFEYPHLVNSLRDNTKTYVVKLIEKSNLLAEGNFSIEYSDEEIITATLTATPGNIPQKVWQKKLNTFDLGQDITPSQNLNNTFYQLNAIEMLGTYTDVFGGASTGPINFINAINNIFFRFKLEIFLGTTKIFDEGYTPQMSEIGTTEATTIILTDMLERFNNAQANTNVNELNYANNEFLGIFSGVKTNPLKMVFTYYLNGSESQIRTAFTFIIQPKTAKTITNYFDNSLKSTWTKPYFFPEIISPKHYGQKSIFNGIINQTTGGVIGKNTNIITEKTKYSHVPMLNFVWVLKKIFSLQGYQLSGSFIDHPEVKKILIFNLFTTDKLIDGISYPLNVHNPTITYANHLPSETFADYLQMVIDEFGLALQFNPLTKTVSLNFFSDVLASTSFLDLSDRLSRKHRNNHAKAKKIQVTWSISGDSLAKNEVIPYISVPTKEVVEAKKDDYEPLQLKIPGLIGDSNLKPKIEAACISPLFEQSKNISPLRFIFYEGNTAKTETAALSFDLTKAIGIYQKILKKKIDFDDTTLNTEGSVILTLQELVSFNFSEKIYGLGVKWLASSLSVKLKTEQNQYLAEIKLKRVI